MAYADPLKNKFEEFEIDPLDEEDPSKRFDAIAEAEFQIGKLMVQAVRDAINRMKVGDIRASDIPKWTKAADELLRASTGTNVPLSKKIAELRKRIENDPKLAGASKADKDRMIAEIINEDVGFNVIDFVQELAKRS